MTSITFHLIGIILTLIANTLVNTIAIKESKCTFHESQCQSNVQFILTNAQLAIGFIIIIMCFIFAIYMHSRLMDACCCGNSQKRQTHAPVLSRDNSRPSYPDQRNPFLANNNNSQTNPFLPNYNQTNASTSNLNYNTF
jgi:amino acid transporter